MTDIPWYSEATLFTDAHLRRAGTLVQCVRKWSLLDASEQPDAHIKLSVEVNGAHRLNAEQIVALMNRAGYRNA